MVFSVCEITTKLQEVVNVSEFMLSGLVEFSVCEMAARLELIVQRQLDSDAHR
jgi:hypothetical protein